ncbi:MAG: cytochrome-c oxidase [Niastella sp. SCN 39-18]|nr:cytochrome c [Sphingobacteriales bacterium]ODT50092.1 MAG: cytochrome-c oxidase [Niastella sp. SCN 39-18]OJW07142.1 MAG: cytochrome-c oxidase [Sphingobacteriales bacterium 39-19]
MSAFDNHKKLFGTAFVFFAALTIWVAVIPALHNQKNNAPLPGAKPLTEAERKGKDIYIANGCVACHTQQVRNIDMDKMWGERPGVAADYAGNHRLDFLRNTATLMGTERTGPDLTNIGNRQPSADWQLVHLYNPRTVVKESIMPAYPWLFTYKEKPGKNDVIVNVPDEFKKGKTGKVVATKDALNLVAYLQSLKQVPLPDGTPSPEFLYKRNIAKVGDSGKPAGMDGQALYTANCQSCHQSNGEGLAGAFPPLKGSKIVDGDDLNIYVGIIMHGYDARAEYGVMPAIGTTMKFTENEIAAIINYERSSWGNNGKQVTPDEIKKALDSVNTTLKK